MEITFTMNLAGEQSYEFLLGDMTFYGNQGTLSSTDLGGAGAMMLSISVGLFLDQLAAALKKKRGFQFTGVGSAFAFECRVKNGKVSLISKGKIYHIDLLTQLVADVLQAANVFYNLMRPRLGATSSEMEDLNHSITALKAIVSNGPSAC